MMRDAIVNSIQRTWETLKREKIPRFVAGIFADDIMKSIRSGIFTPQTISRIRSHRPCSCGSQFKIYRDHEHMNGWILICDNESTCCEVISVHMNGKTQEDAWRAWDGIN